MSTTMNEAAQTARELQARLLASVGGSGGEVTTAKPGVASPEPPKHADLTKLDELAFKDVERRAEGVVQLILHNDRKGGQFALAYVTVVLAVGGALHAYKESIPIIAAIPALVAISILTVGTIFALAAQWTAAMYPTGRLPDFWDWSRRHDISPKDVIDAHLTSSLKAIEHNDVVNTRSALRVKRAGACGVFAFSLIGFGMALSVAKLTFCRASPMMALLGAWAEPLCRL